MEQKSQWGLLRKRNILGAVLVAGMVAGVYMADFWKGFGFGKSGNSNRQNGAPSGSTTAGSTTTTAQDSSSNSAMEEDIQSAPNEPVTVVKIIIANRSYSLKTADGEQPIDLPRIVELAKNAKGDDDGIRVRIFRKRSSRVQTEKDLENALIAAGIEEKEMVFMPAPMEDR